MNIHSQGDVIAADASPRSRELRRLMDERGLHVVYQPILDVRQGHHFACDARTMPQTGAKQTPLAPLSLAMQVATVSSF
jgi:EAL domain-containing protein (putative c-di-GMP-specific phosphodiesterase class I)